MFRVSRSTVTELSRELRGLPRDFLHYTLVDAQLVVGPTGVFVIVEAPDDPVEATYTAVDRAERLRHELSDRLAWVPFVDAVVGTADGAAPPTAECVVVAVDMIHDMIANGPRIIDAQTMMQLALLDLPRTD